MINTYRKRQFILAFVDVVLLIASIQTAFFLRIGDELGVLITHTGASFFTVIIYMIFLYIFDLYDANLKATGFLFFIKIASACLVSAVIITFLFYTFPFWKYGRGIWFIQMIIALCLLYTWRLVYFRLIPRNIETENAFILGAGSAGYFFSEWMNKIVVPFRIKGFIDDESKIGTNVGQGKVLGKTSDIIKIGKRENVKTILIAPDYHKSPECIKNILSARLCGWNIIDIINLYEEITHKVPVRHIHNEWLLFADGFFLLQKPYVQKTKRLLDILLSILLLGILSPFVLLSAFAIKLDSSGSVFYRQDRVGKDGKVFSLFKLRSMVNNAEKGKALWAQRNDPRVTRVGKWLRLTRIDEVPQFFNVLKGDMSLIGPRPERPEFVCDLEKDIPYYSIRHTIRPGLTGWAQVNYRYAASADDALIKLEYDVYYIKNMSLILDLQILLKTVGIVLLGQGAR